MRRSRGDPEANRQHFQLDLTTVRLGDVDIRTQGAQGFAVLIVEKTLVGLDVVHGAVRIAAAVAGRDHRILPQEGRVDLALHFLQIFRKDQRVECVSGLLNARGRQSILARVMIEPNDLRVCVIELPALQSGRMGRHAQTLEKLALL